MNKIGCMYSVHICKMFWCSSQQKKMEKTDKKYLVQVVGMVQVYYVVKNIQIMFTVCQVAVI